MPRTAELTDRQRPAARWTGITYTPEKALQPYTVWVKGEIIAFCVTQADAKRRLAAMLQD